METRAALFVDDEEKILRSLRRGLREEPYKTFFASSGKEALIILQQEPVHVLVTDMRMPEMDGLELLKIVKTEHPYIIRMVLSGYTDMDTTLAAINEGEIFRFIAKPWELEGELKTAIRQAIEFYNLHSERELLMDFFELCMKGIEPELTNFQLLQELVSTRRKHLYKWSKKCDSVALNSQ